MYRESLNGKSQLVPSPQSSGKLKEGVEERLKKSGCVEDGSGTWPTGSTRQASHGRTESEVASMDPEWILTRSSAYML